MPLKKGVAVAASPAAFREADPFEAYVVVDVHKDKTVDLAPRGHPARVVASRVKSKHLTVIK